MANELHGLDACIYVDGVKFENAAGWTIGIVGEECEVIEFEQIWKELLRGVLAGGGTITAYHDQDAKILAELAQSSTTKALILYPDCTDDSTYYTFDAWFDFEHTADVGSCQGQTSPFRVDGSVSKIGFECMLLKDSFTTAEGAPMATPHTALPGPGILVLDQTDGNFLTTGGNFVWPVQAAGPVWGAQEWYATTDAAAAYTRALGLVLKYRVAVTTADEAIFGFNVDTTPTDESESEHCIRVLGASAGFDVHWGAGPAGSSPVLKDIWPALTEYAQIAIVLSPFDVNGVHWYPSTALTSAYGAHYLFRDESATYPHTLLAWYCSAEHTSPLYPFFSNLDSAGIISYCVIPCATFETPLLAPSLVDTFAGTSALAAHTPDYNETGNVWIEHEGSWSVASGYVSPDASAPAHAVQTCHSPDKWVEAIITPGTDTLDIGLTLRESEDTAGGHNAWTSHIQSGVAGVDTWLDEYNDGAVTNRDSADNDWVVDTDYRMKVRMLDEAITAYVDDVEVLNYASAWFNKFATQHGLYASGMATAQFDDMLVMHVGSGLQLECYDSFSVAEDLNIHVTDEGALPWIIDVGTWADDGAEADPDATANARCHVVTGSTNAWVEVRALTAANEWVGALVRGSADSIGGGNYWYCEITNVAGVDEQIVECRDGVHTVRASADIDNAAARWYIQVRCRDNDIRMWVDGADELGYASAGWNNAAVWHGLFNNDDTAAKFDQFRVMTINTYGEYDATVDAIS